MLRTTVPESFEKKKKYSTEGLPRSGGLWACLWGDFLVVSWCRKAQPTVGNTISLPGGPRLYKKASWLNEPVSNISPWFLLQVLA